MLRPTVMFVALVLALAACGGEDEATTTTTLVDTEPTTATTVAIDETTTTTDPEVDADVWPLTGRDSGGADTEKPILIAKIDNTANSRPQVGLDHADMVIEVLVEGGVPRLLAFFQSNMPAEVGPVRSAREVDPKLVAPFGALMAHSGGQDPVVVGLRQVTGDVSHPTMGANAYFRDPSRPGTYDLVLRTADVLGLDSPEAPGFGWMTFGEAPGKDDNISLALSVTVSQSSAHTLNYRYSESNGGYLRFIGDTPHLVLGAEETYANRNNAVEGANPQLVAANVIVVYVPVIDTGRKDAAGSVVPDYDVLGSGVAVIFRDGVAIEGRWERSAANEFFRFVDADGNDIPLAEGSTWIQLTPLGRSLNWE